jgi:hypothetical protein
MNRTEVAEYWEANADADAARLRWLRLSRPDTNPAFMDLFFRASPYPLAAKLGGGN